MGKGWGGLEVEGRMVRTTWGDGMIRTMSSECFRSQSRSLQHSSLPRSLPIMLLTEIVMTTAGR
jgi:hypothetical protein